MSTSTRNITRLADYTPPPFLIDEVALRFELGIASFQASSIGLGHLLYRLVGALHALRRGPASAPPPAPAAPNRLPEADARAEELLRVTRESQARADRTLELLETERMRIARELHDETGQLVQGMRLELDLMQARSEPTGGSPTDLESRARLTALVERLSASVRHVLDGLRPRVLDDLGLAAAIDELAVELRGRGSLRVYREIDESIEAVLPSIGIAIYRVAQEALTNVAKHANASSVWISLQRRDAETLVLEIDDDGQGLMETETAAALRRGHGLPGMRERADGIGARLTLERIPEGRTRLRLIAPLSLRSTRS